MDDSNEGSSLVEGRKPRPQSPACDRCSQGVMDAGNPHLWGECACACHKKQATNA